MPSHRTRLCGQEVAEEIDGQRYGVDNRMSQPSCPHISIFIPTYNDEKDLSTCIESLRYVRYAKQKLELVVWDNGSSDDTVPMVEARFQTMVGEGWASLRLIQNRKNDGCYIPYNLVVSSLAPQAEYILGLDADVELEPDALLRLVEAARNERVAVVGARSVVYSNPIQTAHGAGFVNRLTATYSDRDARERIECDYVIGCCWLLDKRLFQELGGFSPDFFINHWEVDYCLRAKTRRWRILYEPAAVAKHKVQYPATCSTERMYYMFRNKLLMIRHNDYFKSPSLAMALCVLLSSGRILSSAIQTGNVKDAFKAWHGLYDGLRNVTGAISQGP